MDQRDQINPSLTKTLRTCNSFLTSLIEEINYSTECDAPNYQLEFGKFQQCNRGLGELSLITMPRYVAMLFLKRENVRESGAFPICVVAGEFVSSRLQYMYVLVPLS